MGNPNQSSRWSHRALGHLSRCESPPCSSRARAISCTALRPKSVSSPAVGDREYREGRRRPSASKYSVIAAYTRGRRTRATGHSSASDGHTPRRHGYITRARASCADLKRPRSRVLRLYSTTY